MIFHDCLMERYNSHDKIDGGKTNDNIKITKIFRNCIINKGLRKSSAALYLDGESLRTTNVFIAEIGIEPCELYSPNTSAKISRKLRQIGVNSAQTSLEDYLKKENILAEISAAQLYFLDFTCTWYGSLKAGRYPMECVFRILENSAANDIVLAINLCCMRRIHIDAAGNDWPHIDGARHQLYVIFANNHFKICREYSVKYKRINTNMFFNIFVLTRAANGKAARVRDYIMRPGNEIISGFSKELSLYIDPATGKRK